MITVQFREDVSEMTTKPHFFLFPTEHKAHLASTLVLQDHFSISFQTAPSMFTKGTKINA